MLIHSVTNPSAIFWERAKQFRHGRSGFEPAIEVVGCVHCGHSIVIRMNHTARGNSQDSTSEQWRGIRPFQMIQMPANATGANVGRK